MDLSLEVTQIPLDGIQFLKGVNWTTQLGVTCKCAEGALNLTVCGGDEDTEQYWSKMDS